MTLLQLQDVTYRYKNTAEAVLYQINYHFEPGKLLQYYWGVRSRKIHTLVPTCFGPR